ncbi:MAG TPA: hypothetical protein VD994_04480 [Prosthecobacter sp.]|nr:hypothetical protein [Prosthecobacter sp.]
MTRIQSLIALLVAASCCATAAEFQIGAATIDITPDQPVALDGQRNVRIATEAKSRIYATVLALESGTEQAIMVACDLVAIRSGILQKVRDKVAPRLPGFDPRNLFLSATHTHTAPVTIAGRYSLPDEGIMQPEAYAEWMIARMAEGIVTAWKERRPGKVGWAQSQAVIAQNRRVTYANGSAVMYGKVQTPEFRGLEGYEDHNVDVLFFWDLQDKLLATAINVPCPSQEVGGSSYIHADFWDPVRTQLRAKHGLDLHVLAWTGAAGDHTSRMMVGSAADERMRKLRGGLSRLDELGRRIVLAWEDAHACAAKDVRLDPILEHRVEDIQLPWREVTILERAAAMTEAASFAKDPKQHWNYRWNQSVVDRFAAQKNGTAGSYGMELHTLRLGDVAIATNDFELFTDYGVQMKARSPAVQTFVIQLAGPGSYLPTERAVKGGGYSAVIQSSHVGPEGGQVLVERTVEALNHLWTKE